ncbi:MAG: ABC transporter permease [Eubacteriales bacterium]|nr:ABC transporter permease [Eubacteriales bacterium]
MKKGFRKNFKLTRKVFSYPYILFLTVFVVVPLSLLLVNSFLVDGKLSFDNFKEFFSGKASLLVLANSIIVGLVTTGLCLLLGYPVAYLLVKFNAGKMFVLLFILPMWVNFLIRTLATKAIFVALGVKLGMFTVVFGMVYNYLPFMILPLYTTLSGMDKSYAEAAKDLGADPMNVLVKTILPMSLPGIISGITMVFIPTISTFAISQLLSDSTIYLFGDSIQTKFDQGVYGVGSIMSIVMLVMVLVSNYFINKFNRSGDVRRSIW